MSNGLYLTCLLSHDEEACPEEVLDSCLRTMFSAMPESDYCVYFLPPQVSSFEPVNEPFEPIYRETSDCDVTPALSKVFEEVCSLFASREDYVPTLNVRLAAVEDHDDIAPIFDSQSENIAASFGDFFLAELIEQQDENHKVLAGSVDGIAVGLMSIGSEVDLSTLNRNFDLSSFNGLHKITWREDKLFHLKFIAEQRLRRNWIGLLQSHPGDAAEMFNQIAKSPDDAKYTLPTERSESSARKTLSAGRSFISFGDTDQKSSQAPDDEQVLVSELVNELDKRGQIWGYEGLLGTDMFSDIIDNRLLNRLMGHHASDFFDGSTAFLQFLLCELRSSKLSVTRDMVNQTVSVIAGNRERRRRRRRLGETIAGIPFKVSDLRAQIQEDIQALQSQICEQRKENAQNELQRIQQEQQVSERRESKEDQAAQEEVKEDDVKNVTEDLDAIGIDTDKNQESNPAALEAEMKLTPDVIWVPLENVADIIADRLLERLRDADVETSLPMSTLSAFGDDILREMGVVLHRDGWSGINEIKMKSNQTSKDEDLLDDDNVDESDTAGSPVSPENPENNRPTKVPPLELMTKPSVRMINSVFFTSIKYNPSASLIENCFTNIEEFNQGWDKVLSSLDIKRITVHGYYNEVTEMHKSGAVTIKEVLGTARTSHHEDEGENPISTARSSKGGEEKADPETARKSSELIANGGISSVVSARVAVVPSSPLMESPSSLSNMDEWENPVLPKDAAYAGGCLVGAILGVPVLHVASIVAKARSTLEAETVSKAEQDEEEERRRKLEEEKHGHVKGKVGAKAKMAQAKAKAKAKKQHQQQSSKQQQSARKAPEGGVAGLFEEDRDDEEDTLGGADRGVGASTARSSKGDHAEHALPSYTGVFSPLFEVLESSMCSFGYCFTGLPPHVGRVSPSTLKLCRKIGLELPFPASVLSDPESDDEGYPKDDENLRNFFCKSEYHGLAEFRAALILSSALRLLRERNETTLTKQTSACLFQNGYTAYEPQNLVQLDYASLAISEKKNMDRLPMHAASFVLSVDDVLRIPAIVPPINQEQCPDERELESQYAQKCCPPFQEKYGDQMIGDELKARAKKMWSGISVIKHGFEDIVYASQENKSEQRNLSRRFPLSFDINRMPVPEQYKPARPTKPEHEKKAEKKKEDDDSEDESDDEEELLLMMDEKDRQRIQREKYEESVAYACVSVFRGTNWVPQFVSVNYAVSFIFSVDVSYMLRCFCCENDNDGRIINSQYKEIVESVPYHMGSFLLQSGMVSVERLHYADLRREDLRQDAMVNAAQEAYESNPGSVIDPRSSLPVDTPRLSNAFCITVFCLDTEFHARAKDFLPAAFASFPDKEYLVLTQPYASAEIPLIPYLVSVPALSGATHPHALYIAHRDSVLSYDLDLYLSALKPEMWPHITSFTSQLDSTTGRIVREEAVHSMESTEEADCVKTAMPVFSNDALVGLLILSDMPISPKEINALQSSFDIEKFVDADAFIAFARISTYSSSRTHASGWKELRSYNMSANYSFPVAMRSVMHKAMMRTGVSSLAFRNWGGAVAGALPPSMLEKLWGRPFHQATHIHVEETDDTDDEESLSGTEVPISLDFMEEQILGKTTEEGPGFRDPIPLGVRDWMVRVTPRFLRELRPFECPTESEQKLKHRNFSPFPEVALRDLEYRLSKGNLRTGSGFGNLQYVYLSDVGKGTHLSNMVAPKPIISDEDETELGIDDDARARLPIDVSLEDPRSLCHSLYLTTPKLLAEPKITVNTRIVIIGASDTGLSVLNTLLSVPYLKFTQLTVVSPGGICPELPPYAVYAPPSVSKRSFENAASLARQLTEQMLYHRTAKEKQDRHKRGPIIPDFSAQLEELEEADNDDQSEGELSEEKARNAVERKHAIGAYQSAYQAVLDYRIPYPPCGLPLLCREPTRRASSWIPSSGSYDAFSRARLSLSANVRTVDSSLVEIDRADGYVYVSEPNDLQLGSEESHQSIGDVKLGGESSKQEREAVPYDVLILTPGLAEPTKDRLTVVEQQSPGSGSGSSIVRRRDREDGAEKHLHELLEDSEFNIDHFCGWPTGAHSLSSTASTCFLEDDVSKLVYEIPDARHPYAIGLSIALREKLLAMTGSDSGSEVDPYWDPEAVDKTTHEGSQSALGQRPESSATPSSPSKTPAKGASRGAASQGEEANHRSNRPKTTLSLLRDTSYYVNFDASGSARRMNDRMAKQHASRQDSLACSVGVGASRDVIVWGDALEAISSIAALLDRGIDPSRIAFIRRYAPLVSLRSLEFNSKSGNDSKTEKTPQTMYPINVATKQLDKFIEGDPAMRESPSDSFCPVEHHLSEVLNSLGIMQLPGWELAGVCSAAAAEIELAESHVHNVFESTQSQFDQSTNSASQAEGHPMMWGTAGADSPEAKAVMAQQLARQSRTATIGRVQAQKELQEEEGRRFGINDHVLATFRRSEKMQPPKGNFGDESPSERQTMANDSDDGTSYRYEDSDTRSQSSMPKHARSVSGSVRSGRKKKNKQADEEATEVCFECRLLIAGDLKDVDNHFFRAVNGCGLVYDGRLVVDHNFQTVDSSIYAGGPVTQFSRKYRTPTAMDLHNSMEVGTVVAKKVLQSVDPLQSHNSDSLVDTNTKHPGSTLLPQLSKPRVIVMPLPGVAPLPFALNKRLNEQADAYHEVAIVHRFVETLAPEIVALLQSPSNEHKEEEEGNRAFDLFGTFAERIEVGTACLTDDFDQGQLEEDQDAEYLLDTPISASGTVLMFCRLPYYESGDTGREFSTTLKGRETIQQVDNLTAFSSAAFRGDLSISTEEKKDDVEASSKKKSDEQSDMVVMLGQDARHDEGVHLLKELIHLSHSFRRLCLFTDRFGRVASLLYFGSIDNYPEVGNLARLVGKQMELCGSSLRRDYDSGRIKDLLSFLREDSVTALYHDRFDALINYLRKIMGEDEHFASIARKIAQGCAEGKLDEELSNWMRESVGIRGRKLGETMRRELSLRLLSFIRQNRSLLPHFFSPFRNPDDECALAFPSYSGPTC